MQSAKPISVVLSGSVEASVGYIQQVHQELSSTGRRVDVLCVERATNGANLNSTLVENVHVRTVQTVAEALEMAYFETVLILQGQPALESVRLKGLIEKLNADTFICSYSRQKLSRGYKRGLMWMNHLLTSVLLKADIGQFDNGMLVFQRSHKTIAAIAEVATPLQAIAEEESMPTLGQLVSGLKMAGKFHVITTMDDFANHTEPAQRVNSKSILSAKSKTIRTWWNTIMFPQPAPLGAKKSERKQRALKIGAWALLCLVAGLMLNQNLKYPFFEPDESRNAQLALNILDSGNWMALELKNEHYWDKPPLVAWMTAVSFPNVRRDRERGTVSGRRDDISISDTHMRDRSTTGRVPGGLDCVAVDAAELWRSVVRTLPDDGFDTSHVCDGGLFGNLPRQFLFEVSAGLVGLSWSLRWVWSDDQRPRNNSALCAAGVAVFMVDWQTNLYDTETVSVFRCSCGPNRRTLVCRDGDWDSRFSHLLLLEAPCR